jgi:hypothetical protein
VNKLNFPVLRIVDWRATRDALHDYARVLGYFRRELTPPQKHWWHITLSVSARGLTTTPMPGGSGAVELTLSPIDHCVDITSSGGATASIPLVGQSAHDLAVAIASALDELGVAAQRSSPTLHKTPHDYDPAAAARFWAALASVDLVFKEFKGRLREESGPVQIFPHHFDLSLNWFSGRHVPGVDPADADNADEQMNFGFVTGDASIADAYFYATAYPTPDGLTRASLPDDAAWQTEGFTGAVMPYATIAEANDGRARLLAFLEAAQRAGADLMR